MRGGRTAQVTRQAAVTVMMTPELSSVDKVRNYSSLPLVPIPGWLGNTSA